MSKQPNIVVILTDDQGYGDLSCTGNTNLSTPNIDKLSNDGATLEHFYVQPMCAPTRAEFLTGRYYSRTGVHGVTRRAERINLDEVTIADVFRDNGYKTGCFGKWHSGLQYPYHPNGRGFDEFTGYCCGHWSHYFDSTIEHNGKEFNSKGYLTDALTDAAIDFIEANKDQPFFCYVPLNTPHAPFQVPDEYFNRFTPEGVKLRADKPDKENIDMTMSVLAMCENIDWNVGRIVETLEKQNLTEDTIVIYFSDNGPNTVRWNAGLTGKKCDAEEGGVRSACFVKWPDVIPAGHRVDEIAGAIDFLPTLTKMAGINHTSEKPLDGLDISPLLLGGRSAHADRMIFAREVSWNGERSKISVRTNQYRCGGNLDGLYDMNLDEGQKNDLSNKYPKTADSLNKAIKDFEEAMPPDISDPVIPVGYKEFLYTDLPVQDAELKGDVTWSSIHPNASYLINWNSLDDEISWNIEVMLKGDYKVKLMYTCGLSSVGTAISATFNGSDVAGRILKSFESEVKDDMDRVKRDESYDKAFYTMELGTISLEPGKGDLVLKGLEMTGKNICDLRALRLELIS